MNDHCKATSDGGVFIPYNDPRLKGRRRRRFLRDLQRRGLLSYTRTAKSFCGMFFVCKKDGSLRLIIDARGTNEMFMPPPPVDLLTSEGFSRIEVDVPEELPQSAEETEDWLRSVGVHIGMADVNIFSPPPQD